MAVGDLTKVPSGGIQISPKVARLCGTTTTMYEGSEEGQVKSLTTAGVFAELTTPAKLPGRIVALVYTGITVTYGGVSATTAIIAILEDGNIYVIQPDGSVKYVLRNLNCGVRDAYYYSNYLYVVLDGVPQEGSSVVKIQLA
jgi:hypothetical protein